MKINAYDHTTKDILVIGVGMLILKPETTSPRATAHDRQMSPEAAVWPPWNH